MLYKNGRYYMVKFMWQGKIIRKSTRASNAKTARSIESKIRSEIAQGNFGILAPQKAKPSLAEFFEMIFCRSLSLSSKKHPKPWNIIITE